MKLKDLLKDVTSSCLSGSMETEVTSIAYDSRKVSEGTLFVCLRGFATDGHKYIDDAVKAGAAAILAEEDPDHHTGVTVVKTDDTRKALAFISARWFGHPAEKMTMIGLTGTKGKTTVAHMIKKILEEEGRKVGMIGTLGAFIGSEKMETRNTTPESYELHHMFRQMLDAGCSHVVMEVSSQGLKMHRTDGITFDYAAFLNISPDHIGAGEHEDFDDYLNCKKRLFSQARVTVANIDDSHWQEVTADADEVYTVSLIRDADFMGRNIRNIWEPKILGVEFEITGKFDEKIVLNMPGAYNAENALTAAGIAYLMGVSPDIIARGISETRVKGRTQLLTDVHFSTFLIDYAHNALSMENLLKTLREYEPKRLICLFGGGGNKARQRRFDMGEMAGKYADLTIITLDNPRFDSTEEINKDIIRGLDVYGGEYKVIMDREEAIHYLIDNCGEGDIVALIGKGHEEYQEIEGVKHFFSEEKIVSEYLRTK